MLNRMKDLGIGCRDSVFCADRRYDSGGTCGMLFGMGMVPNIKQKRNAVSRSKSFRRRAAALFGKRSPLRSDSVPVLSRLITN